MGLYKSANDMSLRLNGKNGAEARMAAAAIGDVLDDPLTELVKQAQYQSQVLHAINENLTALVKASSQTQPSQTGL